MSVRGYAKWKPKAEALYWVRVASQVLDEFQDYWPLSVRQIFYRLVADHGYDKTEAAYNRLTGYLSRSRRAGLLEWNAIRDGGLGRGVHARYFDGEEGFMDAVRRNAETMQLNRQQNQPAVIELWCEAGGMVPILQGIAGPYSCRVNTGGGYDSVTAKHRLAERVRDRAAAGLRTIILHVGDFDGSGEDMANVLHEDARHMVVRQVLDGVLAGEIDEDYQPEHLRKEMANLGSHWSREAILWALDHFDVQRVALTAKQVVERGVETAPPKPSDSRTVEFVRRNQWVVEELGTDQISAQLEALAPPDLEELLRGAIEGHLDMDLYGDVLAEEQRVREALLERLGANE